MFQRAPYTDLLPFRSPNVIQNLAPESAVPLFNGKHLLGLTAERNGCLWMPAVRHRSAIAGALRAAAHLKSVLGFALRPRLEDPGSMRRNHAPGRLFDDLTSVCQEVLNVPPFCLHVQEPQLPPGDRGAVEAIRSHVAACAEAGFTSVGLDFTGWLADEIPDPAVALLEPFARLELSLWVKLSSPGAEVAEQVRHVVSVISGFKRRGKTPDVVLLPGPEELGRDAWELALEIEGWIAPCLLGWSDPGKALPRAMESHLGGASIQALIGAAAPASESPGDKLEAITYMETLDRLERLGSTESALALSAVLERQS